jgi:hypothetical protein
MSFYKYTNISTASLILKNNKLRWSSPILFNDLEECQFTPFTKDGHLKASEDYIKILTEFAKGRNPNYNLDKFSNVTKMIIELMKISINRGTFSTNNFIETMSSYIPDNPESDYRNFINIAFIKCFRILCVTKNYDNQLMWAHYANQNYGCVMEFENLYTIKPAFLREGFVRYHENLQPRSNPLDILLYGETKEIRDLMMKDVAFSKRTSWSYENEYRFLFHENFGQITTELDVQTKEKKTSVKYQSDKLFTDVSFPKESVKSVIFGVRTTNEDISRIRDLLLFNHYQCECYKMSLSDGQFIKEKLE